MKNLKNTIFLTTYIYHIQKHREKKKKNKKTGALGYSKGHVLQMKM